ncbi:vanillin synthase /trans-feruloyl-CoA hydratase [Sphaerotilus hippei]|uniref:Vanillin synthase /trans-feruloyl-CoA hydratase n=1 Tax=Sphaerotilus hippei TaxID=744406 RepID=A0A318H357_9BURK|nr:crotonase/enoyl-CoA hydratase family protein [Sphaerotilus hippei]PXW97657.1 vanillin synthase /trans-feruloyl-CoA hydratase [Sphaerotilus hippei]
MDQANDSISSAGQPVTGLLASLDLLRISRSGEVLHVCLNRPEKRNAISDTLIRQLQTAFIHIPDGVRAAVISGAGEHFCAGLDLAELVERDVGEGVLHSRMWHAAFDQIQFGRVPVVAALHGAVVGGGLELASACHLRVAGRDAYFALPEGQRGLFVGGGGSARIPRLIGVARMSDMMLTGRVHEAAAAEQMGLVQYVCEPGTVVERALALAARIARNAPLSNYAVMHALPRIADQSQSEGLFTESLMAAVAESTPDAQERLRAFLDKRAAKVERGG